MMKYSEMTTTNEPYSFCHNCSEYKGMMDCTVCCTPLCIFCTDGCEGCGAEIDWSK